MAFFFVLWVKNEKVYFPAPCGAFFFLTRGDAGAELPPPKKEVPANFFCYLIQAFRSSGFKKGESICRNRNCSEEDLLLLESDHQERMDTMNYLL